MILKSRQKHTGIILFSGKKERKGTKKSTCLPYLGDCPTEGLFYRQRYIDLADNIIGPNESVTSWEDLVFHLLG